MANDVQVVADGVESRVEPERSTPPILALLVALALAAGLVIFVVTPGDPPTPTASTSPELMGPLLSPDEAEQEMGISELMEGFGEAIVAVVADDEDVLTHVLWPAARRVVTRPMTVGSNPLFAEGSVHIALVQEIAGVDGAVLITGRVSSMGPVAAGVTSYAWHDELGGHIGYTTEDTAGTSLFTAPASRNPRLITSNLDRGDRLVAWGDWGFAVQSQTGDLVLLNPEGVFRDVHPGRVFDSHPSGWVIAAGDTLDLVSAGGGVSRLDVSVAAVGKVDSARFSPNGSRVALAGERGVFVVSAAGDGPVSQFALEAAGRMTWSQDGRFIVLPERSGGIRVLDLDRNVQKVLLAEAHVLAVGLIPLAS